jgi:hypothetical protein
MMLMLLLGLLHMQTLPNQQQCLALTLLLFCFPPICMCPRATRVSYLSKLAKGSDGTLTAVATEPIKDGPNPTWFPCSGIITPWDSHLGR